MAADEASKLEAETQDEIEQIMSEIEELQQEMTQSAAAPAAAPAAPATTSAAADDLESDRSMSEFVTVEDDGASTTFPDAQASSGGGSSSSEDEEPWVQETLAELNKPEPRASSRAMPVAADAAPEFTNAAAASGGRITLGVQGSLDVCLKHEGSGTELVIEFSGDSVHVIVSGGAEFKIPLQAVPRSLRRVA